MYLSYSKLQTFLAFSTQFTIIEYASPAIDL
jgi:hypothetical protein